MNISSALAGYVHSAVVQPKPAQPRHAHSHGDRDGRIGNTQQQQQQASTAQPAATGSVNLLV